MVNHIFAVTTIASVEAATPQEAAEKMLAQLGKARSARFDVVDESGSTFHVTVQLPKKESAPSDSSIGSATNSELIPLAGVHPRRD